MTSPKKDFYHDIDLRNHSLLNTTLEAVTDLPGSPQVGRVLIYQGLIRWWDGAQWRVAGGFGDFQGAFDASGTVFPDEAEEGMWWFVETGGDVDGMVDPALSPGDILVAGDDTGTEDPANWVFIYMQRDQATEDTYGVLKLASIEDVRDGTDHTKAVTPLGLAGMKATEPQALDPDEEDRFITPHALWKVTATEERMGIMRIATEQEVTEGTVDDAAVTPAYLAAYVPETPDREPITETPLQQIKLISPDESIWTVTIDDAGAIQTDKDE